MQKESSFMVIFKNLNSTNIFSKTRKNLTRNQQKIDRKTKINNGECKGIEREIFNWKMTVRFFALLVFNGRFLFFLLVLIF